MKDRIFACWRNWSWLCPWAMMVTAAGILMIFGLTFWTAILVVILLVCPAVMLWGAWQVRRRRE
jgi:hypothetical protein